MLFITLSSLLALALDKLIGEAERFHPLVGFGTFANFIEQGFNRKGLRKLKGLLALLLCIVPFCGLGLLISLWLADDWLAQLIFSGFMLYIALGWRSLLEHAQAVAEPLRANNLPAAREAVARIVSRDCSQLDDTDIATAATESVLENGADAIFAALFWFAIAGVPGLICYRLANTLDAMWGYKNSRFEQFGWAAARLDDILNYLPARLTAFSYALVGHTRQAFTCWFKQAKFWKSPNAGPVMAAGAGAIKVSLGGRAVYHGTTHLRPLLGLKLSNTSRADAHSIQSACRLVNKSLALWLVIFILITCLHSGELVTEFSDALTDLLSQ